MIPVKLSIQGLYSYQDKQTIDFTRLTAANLFGIFGTVGSGKSSILEAITFAVYGKTTRLNQSGDNRYYNMMNLKSDELLIDFIFEAGREQTQFRATVKGKRNSKNFEDVRALVRSAYKLIDNKWIPVETEILEQAVGLSYDNFRRTIIIPQGQFQEFLQLGNKDRTQMMKELFNLGKFEFYYKVTALESKNNGEIQRIEGQLKQLGDIDAEQVKVLEEKLNSLKEELVQLQNKLKEYQSQDDAYKNLQELNRKLKDTEQTLNLLKVREPDIIRLGKLIKDFEHCRYYFKHLLDDVDSGNRRIADKEKQIKEKEDKVKDLNDAYKSLDEQLTVLKPAYDKLDESKQRVEELNLLIKIRNIEYDVSKNEVRLKKGEAYQSKTSNAIEKLKTEKTGLEITLKEQKQKLPDMNVLSDIRAWHIEKSNTGDQLSEAVRHLETYMKENAAYGKQLQDLLADSLFEDCRNLTDIKVLLEMLREKEETFRLQLKSLEVEFAELAVKERLHQYAGELHDGKACPLCGSLSHPEVYTAANIRESKLELQGKKVTFNNDIEKCQAMAEKLKDLQRNMMSGERNVRSWNEKQEELLKKLKAHEELFVWDKCKTKAELDAAIADAGKIKTELDTIEEKLAVNGINLEKEQNNKERYQIELDKITTALITGRAQKRTLLDQLKLIVPHQYAGIEIPEIEQEKKDLERENNKLEKNFNDLKTKAEENRSTVNRIKGGLEENINEFELEKKLHRQKTEQLNHQLDRSEYRSIEEVKEILALTIDPEKEKKDIAEFREQQAVHNERRNQLLVEIGNREYDPELHDQIKTWMEKCKKDSDDKHKEYGKTDELLSKLQEDLKSQKILKNELEKLVLRADNIKTMKSLFKAGGFVNYISSVYLQNLCNVANERFFQLTRQKLSLEITSDNNFQVRDFMNGGKVRSVKTLSGGQTFQAALSLALALADNIQKITDSNQNFFFLDEGFGSLDKESLAVVFDTLKTLRKENRIVGVISHVEEMQQEIDMYLRIENHEDNGSIIKPCWLS